MGTDRLYGWGESDVSVAADLETLVRLVDTGRLHPEIGSVGSGENVAAVVEALGDRRIRGKAVLKTAV
jgi:NADPH:quinone reductase-like Zn-dependent oxidoreductase